MQKGASGGSGDVGSGHIRSKVRLRSSRRNVSGAGAGGDANAIGIEGADDGLTSR